MKTPRICSGSWAYKDAETKVYPTIQERHKGDSDIGRKLVDGTTLESGYHDRSLAGNLKGHRDCHIEPDWLLLYRIDKERQEITFVRTGSHSDLFG